jgi:hypothetical protein
MAPVFTGFDMESVGNAALGTPTDRFPADG